MKIKMIKNRKDFGIKIHTLQNEITIDFNEKGILKAGGIDIEYDKEYGYTVRMSSWELGKKKWQIFRKKLRVGIEIEGDCLTITGEKDNRIEIIDTTIKG